MRTYIEPSRELWSELCLRPSSDNAVVRERVEQIIERVRKDGDDALRQLSEEIDKRRLDTIEVSEEEIIEAKSRVSEKVRTAIALASSNIEKFHKAQLPCGIKVETVPGVVCQQRPVPIEKVGLYIPGGTAPLFSTVLMLAIPARIAGCREVILCTPTGANGKVSAEVLYAANACGVKRIFKLGGAQAIAAMAYGTSTVPAVDKIFGPGNQYVTTAKQMLSGRKVAIDMPAGPSEVMVVADEQANAAFIAADLLSQAEHGRDSQVMLVVPTQEKALEVDRELSRQKAVLPREDFADSALDHSVAVVFKDVEDALAFANAYAPEHLIINTRNAAELAWKVTSAGSVFVGAYTPESAGDYASGTNHTLPTCGWGRSFSGVNIESFIRRMTVQEISRAGLEALSDTIVDMAEAEGLQAHANAVKVRL